MTGFEKVIKYPVYLAKTIQNVGMLQNIFDTVFLETEEKALTIIT